MGFLLAFFFGCVCFRRQTFISVYELQDRFETPGRYTLPSRNLLKGPRGGGGGKKLGSEEEGMGVLIRSSSYRGGGRAGGLGCIYL